VRRRWTERGRWPGDFAAEALAGYSGCVEEGFGEDWCGGEFVFGLLRVVEDEDLGGGLNGV
jgi:hypothetical protein